jgi:hypothetical protein
MADAVIKDNLFVTLPFGLLSLASLFFPLLTLPQSNLLQSARLVDLTADLLIGIFLFNLYLRAGNSKFSNILQPKNTTSLVVETPTTLVVRDLSFPQPLI